MGRGRGWRQSWFDRYPRRVAFLVRHVYSQPHLTREGVYGINRRLIPSAVIMPGEDPARLQLRPPLPQRFPTLLPGVRVAVDVDEVEKLARELTRGVRERVPNDLAALAVLPQPS